MNRFYKLRLPRWSPHYSLYGPYPITVEIVCRWLGKGPRNVAVKLPNGDIIVRPSRGLRRFDGPTTREEHRRMEKEGELEWMAAEPVDTDKAIADLNRALGLNFTPDVKFATPIIDDYPLSADVMIEHGWVEVKPVIDMKMRALCVKPYQGHPKGCPNYGKTDRCPPAAPKINDVLDLDQPVYAIYNRFGFRAHCAKMREFHPGWSRRQIRCCLYWQGSARKQLRNVISKFTLEHPKMIIIMTPEAMGVNITETMANAGIHLEWEPVNYTYQIALGGTSKQNMSYQESLVL